MKTDQFSNQLRWVILLLAAAVILPTVCLLWFMTQAVRNEQLAVRQKLLDICNDGIEELESNLKETVDSQYDNYSRSLIHAQKPDILLWTNALKNGAASVVVYDNDGNLTYPIRGSETTVEFSEQLQAAFELEQQGQFEKALEIYQQAADPNQTTDRFGSCMGQIRCLDKLDRVRDVMDFFHKLLWSEERKWRDQFTANQVAMLRVKKIELLAKHRDTFSDGAMFSGLQAWYTPWENYSAETTIWALGKMLEIAPEFHERHKLDDSIEYAQNTIRTETIALTFADFLDTHPEYKQRPAGQWFAIPEKPDFYGMNAFSENHNAFFIKGKDGFSTLFEQQLEAFPISGTTLVLYDNHNQVVFGTLNSLIVPFIVYDLSDFSADWKLELYFDTDNPFQSAAKRQTSIYIWTGILVSILMSLAGAIAIRTVNKQIKMNRLKNDFIATVTHELKTPLASMRVLVDTLLEGNYEGERTAMEYLQLVANENKRLTHLIDSFLTFSRMERNKLVFEIAAVSPVEVANIAAEAVQTKFDSGNVKFNIDVRKPLSMMRADKDGIVTVLVNLLDNAYKYTNSDKEIQLKVYEQNGSVCFAVKDNGIGLSPRVQRKIFNRFYQVDDRLSRRAEGCGLGLSIVKFIIDAHKGTIEVESEIEKGSTFTVKLPSI
ncbi:MAG: hypothetical protein B6I25_02585 [Planctomycetales bacterium 4572_13]|nr:MAG: hypothetical protein B6I25_02585 [Planctomycetales bacterium 4572_13]